MSSLARIYLQHAFENYMRDNFIRRFECEFIGAISIGMNLWIASIEDDIDQY